MMQRQLTNTKKAAAINGVSVSWLTKNWRKVPGAHRLGRVLRWDPDELRRWMREQAEQKPAA